jgi:hypothetical protein
MDQRNLTRLLLLRRRDTRRKWDKSYVGLRMGSAPLLALPQAHPKPVFDVEDRTDLQNISIGK